MEILKAILLTCVLLLLLISLYLIFENRDSNKLVSNALTTALVSSLGILITVFFSLEVESSKKDIESIVIINNTKNEQHILDWGLKNRDRTFMDGIPRGEIFRKFIYDNKEDTIDIKYNLIIELLERQIFDRINFIFNNKKYWLVDKILFSKTGKFSIKRNYTNSKTINPTILSREKLLKTTRNRLLESYPFFIEDCLVLPTNTIVNNKISNNLREIKFTNKFVETIIKIEVIGGEYTSGKGLKEYINDNFEVNDTYFSSTYLISINSNFSQLRSGHPHMKYYKKWVSLIEQEIENGFGVSKYIKAGII